MRAVGDRSSIAAALTRRTRASLHSRQFSAGIGRGRGETSGRFDDADEPLFTPSFGHGASQGDASKPGFPGGQGGAPSSAASFTERPFRGLGNAPAGRGSDIPAHGSDMDRFTSRPAFPGASAGRGSISRSQGDNSVLDGQPSRRPSLNLGFGGFGRGRAMEKTDSPPEDIFSPDRQGSISRLSKWDERLDKEDAKEGPSPAELRLMQDEHSSKTLAFQSMPDQQSGQGTQLHAVNAPASVSHFQSGLSQQRPPSSPGRQQQNIANQAFSRHVIPSEGWQTPVQEPYYDIKFQQSPSTHELPFHSGKPVYQPYSNASGHLQPSVESAPSSTGLNLGSEQAIQQAYYDEKVQSQPYVQYTQPPTGWHHHTAVRPHTPYTPTPTAIQPQATAPFPQTATLQQQPPPGSPGPNLSDRQPVQQPYYDTNVQSQASMHYMPPPSVFRPLNASPPHGVALQQQPPPGSSAFQPFETSPPPGTTVQQQPPLGPSGHQPFNASPFQGATLHQQPRPGSPAFQPLSHFPPQEATLRQQPHLGSPGWQQQTSEQPSIHHERPPTGWQQQTSERPSIHHERPPTGPVVFQPFNAFSPQGATIQGQPHLGSPGWQQQTLEQPSVHHERLPTAFPSSSAATLPQGATSQQKLYPSMLGLQPETVGQHTSPPTAFWSPSAVSLPQDTSLQQQSPASPGKQAFQGQHGVPSLPHEGFAMDERQSIPSASQMQVSRQHFDPGQPFPESKEGRYSVGGKAIESQHLESVGASDYRWGSKYPALVSDTKGQKETIPSSDVSGLDYEKKVEELFKENKFQEIDGIYSQMKASPIPINAKTYGTIMQSYMQLGKTDKVTEIYQEMSKVLFAETKKKDEKVKETSTTGSVESSTLIESSSTPISFGTPIETSSIPVSFGTRSSGQDVEPETKFKGDEEFKTASVIGTPGPDVGLKGLPSLGHSEPSVGRGIGRGIKMETRPMEASIGVGRGRGKKMEGFFNFDFSVSPRSADEPTGGFVKSSTQLEQEIKTDVQDEYSQTFMPVMPPGWYAFAPEGLTVGPGAGRGRPQSSQPHSVELGGSPAEQLGQGTSTYVQRMQAARQERPPLYSLDSRSQPLEPQFADPEEEEEPFQSSVSAEEAEAAAEQAMKILTEKRLSRFKNMFEFDDDVAKRSPLGLAKSLGERKQPKKERGKTIRLTEEEKKKEAERLKAIEENEALQELHHTFDQFMKFYGEMAVEPEHELGDFTNPDIDEKPFMPLEEYLEKAKPNIMKTGLVRSEKEWEDMVKDTMRHLPYYEEFVERYGGPGRYTAKQENEDLEEIAGTLPSDVGRAAKSFVQRSLTTLKSNPGLHLRQKQWMLASMVDEFSQYIVND